MRPHRPAVVGGARASRIARFTTIAAVCLAASSACGGEKGTGPAPVVASMTLNASSAAPYGIVTGSLTAAAMPATGNVATLGGTAIDIARLDDSTFAFTVPASATGSQTFNLTVGSATYTATLLVTSAPVVADPAAYVTNTIESSEDAIDAFELELNGGLDDLVADTTLRRADIARIRELLEDARQALAAATPDERARLAAFLSANASTFGLSATGATLRSSASLRLGSLQDGACVSSAGTELATYEECSVELDQFGQATQLRLVAMAAGMGIAYVQGFTLIGVVGAAVTALAIYDQLSDIQDETMSRFINPVIAKLVPQEDGEFLLRTADARAAADTAALAIASPAAEEVTPQYFVTGTARPFRVYGDYRSLKATDASIATLSPLVALGRRLDNLISAIRTTLLMGQARPLIPATPRRALRAEIPPRYLSLVSTSPTSVTRTATVSADDWMLRFTRSGITSDVPFTFEYRYAPPAQPVQEEEVTAVLMATPRFIAKSLANGVNAGSMCALSMDDRYYCWGQNVYGKLGDLTTTSRSLPTALLTGTTLRDLVSGEFHACGLTAEGLSRCWGSSYGIGDSTMATESSLSARATTYDLSYSMLAAGRSSTCGLSGGTAYCWGGITNQLDTAGLAIGRDFRRPYVVPGSPSFVSVDVGAENACGLTASGAAYCFGSNQHGEVGDGTSTPRGRPVPVAGNRTWAKLSVSAYNACGITTGGQTYCWGSATQGQIGDGNASWGTSGYTSTPVLVHGGLTFTEIETGWNHACGLTATGKAYCWGDDGNGSGTTPTAVPTTVNFKSLSAGNYFTCGIARTGGGVYCWGMNLFGELGRGTVSNNETVGTVSPPAP